MNLFSGGVNSLAEFMTNCVVEVCAYLEASDLVAKSYVTQNHSMQEFELCICICHTNTNKNVVPI